MAEVLAAAPSTFSSPTSLGSEMETGGMPPMPPMPSRPGVASRDPAARSEQAKDWATKRAEAIAKAAKLRCAQEQSPRARCCMRGEERFLPRAIGPLAARPLI